MKASRMKIVAQILYKQNAHTTSSADTNDYC